MRQVTEDDFDALVEIVDALCQTLDAHGDIPEEFWGHVENVLGRKIPARRRAKYFTCSCLR